MCLHIGKTVVMARAFQNHVYVRPLYIAQISTVADNDFIAINQQRFMQALLRIDRKLKSAVGRIILGEVRDGCQICELINGNNLHMFSQF